jgi:hypothetical protein
VVTINYPEQDVDAKSAARAMLRAVATTGGIGATVVKICGEEMITAGH